MHYRDACAYFTDGYHFHGGAKPVLPFPIPARLSVITVDYPAGPLFRYDASGRVQLIVHQWTSLAGDDLSRNDALDV